MFTEDTTSDFLNPERGWKDRRGRLETRSGSITFTNSRTVPDETGTLYANLWTATFGTPWAGGTGQNPFRLDNYRTQNLPQSLLDELALTFTDARAAGVKLKVRFMYNYANVTNNDTTLAWMLAHMDQIAPVLNDNRDVIAVLDSGFVGAWGEWSILANSVIASGTWWTDPQRSARRTFFLHQLSVLHPDIMIGLRVPSPSHGIRSIWEGSSWQMPLEDRFLGGDRSRVGWYNDSLYTGQDNAGTFDYYNGHGETDRACFAWVGQYAATSGETSEAGQAHTGADAAGSSVVLEMARKGGPDLLFRRYNVAHYNRWISDGHFPQISRRLGYRLTLLEATVPTVITPGAPIAVTLRIKNSGFGKVYNPRPIDLVLEGAGGPHHVRLTADARRALPLAGQTVDLELTGTAPAGLPAATPYGLQLAFPDPDPLSRGLGSRPSYSIRLANVGMWDAATGRHSLGASAQTPA